MGRLPSPSTPYLYAHTLARMRPRQLAGIVERKARGTIVPAIPLDFDRWYDRKVPDNLRLNVGALRTNTATMRDSLEPETRQEYSRQARAAASGTVTFMNRTRTVTSGSRVDWESENRDDVPRLWQLKLYAFEPLAWMLFGDDGEVDSDVRSTFEEWVCDWIETVDIDTPNYLRRAWTPYAVSLRVLYWSRYLACRSRDGGADAFDVALARELYKNASFLANHVERDVGGNHLIENGAGLVAAGTLFGDDGDAWVTTGLSVLEDVSQTQFLSDGCHFERSPMYHIQTLTRYLTVRDLLMKSGRPVPEAIEDVVSTGVAFLEFLRPPDGELPLLNDAVHGQTLSLDACLDYARATGVNTTYKQTEQMEPVSSSQPGPRVEDSSGFGWLDTDVGRMLVDGGPVGPTHLPGHAHSDLLSYLLWLDGNPVVTDTGTFDYEHGERRRYARGVRGHNTVQIDDIEPIELGGRFLMGPRPTPSVRWDYSTDVSFFEGCYIARPFRRARYTHHRSITAGEGWWLVWDRTEGHDAETVRSRVHLHPNVAVSRVGDGALRLVYGDSETGRQDAWVHPVGSAQFEVDHGRYFPEFGVERERMVVTVEATETSVPNGFGYVVTTVDTDAPLVTRDAQERPTAVTLQSETHALPSSQIPLK